MKMCSTLPGLIKELVKKYDKKYPGRLAEVDDERGYPGNAPFWIYTAPGFAVDCCCHTGTADTLEEVHAVLRGIEPCDCPDCMQALSEKSKESDGTDQVERA